MNLSGMVGGAGSALNGWFEGLDAATQRQLRALQAKERTTDLETGGGLIDTINQMPPPPQAPAPGQASTPQQQGAASPPPPPQQQMGPPPQQQQPPQIGGPMAQVPGMMTQPPQQGPQQPPPKLGAPGGMPPPLPPYMPPRAPTPPTPGVQGPQGAGTEQMGLTKPPTSDIQNPVAGGMSLQNVIQAYLKHNPTADRQSLFRVITSPAVEKMLDMTSKIQLEGIKIANQRENLEIREKALAEKAKEAAEAEARKRAQFGLDANGNPTLALGTQSGKIAAATGELGARKGLDEARAARLRAAGVGEGGSAAGPGADALMEAVASGRVMLSDLGYMGKGEKIKFEKQLLQKYPDFDRTLGMSRTATARDFASGTSAKNITAINTALGHADTLGKLSDALKTGNSQHINQAVQAMQTEFSNPSVNNFDMGAMALGDEMMRVFRGVGASETEAKAWKEKFQRIGSPQQQKEAVQTAKTLLQSRLSSLNQQYKRGMNTDKDFKGLVDPKNSDSSSGGIPSGWKVEVVK